MEAGRVVIIEDDVEYCDLAASIIQADGSPHRVVVSADNLLTVWDVLNMIEDGELDCNVILLDDNITPNTLDGQDGRIIAQTVRDRALPVKIIGYSLGKMTFYGVPVDIDVGKQNAHTLRDVLDRL